MLLEMVIGTADEGVGFLELPIDFGLVLRVPALDEDGKALGHKLHLVAEPFDQHAGVTLQFIEPLIDRNKPLVDRSKLLVVRIEPLLDPIESLVYRIEAGIEPLLLSVKSLLQVLNEFLIHTASAV